MLKITPFSRRKAFVANNLNRVKPSWHSRTKNIYVNHGVDYELIIDDGQPIRQAGGKSTPRGTFYVRLPVGREILLEGRIGYKNAFNTISKTQQGFSSVKAKSRGKIVYQGESGFVRTSGKVPVIEIDMITLWISHIHTAPTHVDST